MAATAAITSTSSSSISNVTSNNTTANAALLALTSTSRTSSAGGSEAASIGSLTTSSVVSSSSSRSRRSKISHYYHGSGVASNISSTTTYSNGDSKSMHSSSNVSSSSKSSSQAGGSSSEIVSKSKSGQRKWKEDNGCKTKSLKWKANSEHGASDEEVAERSSSKAAKWKETDKNKMPNANLYKMRGLKWKIFTDNIFESEEELRNINEEDDETVLRLDQSDMGLYGLCPETDPFYAVICDICNAVVKPQGLQKHLAHRHHGSHISKHHSQHAFSHHRHILSSYPAVSIGSHVDRSVADHSTIASQTVGTSATAFQISAADRHEKSPALSKPVSRDVSPGQSYGTHQQSSSRSSGSSGAHSSSITSKSKSKSTNKVKSRSGKNGKSSKSGGNSSSNHSSTAPSPSSSSSSSYSGVPNRSASSSVTSSNASNGVAAPTTLTASNATCASSTTSGPSSTSSASATNLNSFSSSKSSSASITTNQSQTNQKHLRASSSVATLSSYPNAHNNTHLLQSSSQNNAITSSKTSSSASSKHNSIINDSASSTQNNIPASPHACMLSSLNVNNSVTSSSVAVSSNTNVSINSVTPRRTYGRCKSSSAERKNVPIKEREYDANKHCGVVTGESSRPCTRSLTCKAHSLSMRRLVSGRSKSFDKLLADHRATKEQPQNTSKTRTMPEFESSNSSSSIDLDRRSVSSNSNLSVEVQASSTASSQSSVIAASVVETTSVGSKQSTPPPPTTSNFSKGNQSSVLASSSGSCSSSRETGGQLGNNRLSVMPTPIEDIADPAITETVETVCMGENDNTIQININRDGATQAIPNVANRRSNPNASQQSRSGSSDDPHRARITTRVIDTNRVNVPPELLDDAKFATNIFSPESTVLTGPIRLLAEDDNGEGPSKRSRLDTEKEVDISTLSEEKRLQVMVQRKVSKKNKVLFRDPNRPSPSAITIPPAAEIVAQAFAEENPSATLTDAQFVMDPETNVVSVSVCGTFNPDNMQLNWAPFNQEFVNNTLSQALSPYGITVPPVQPTQPEQQQVYGNPNLMPNPEEEGFQIHHLPPLTEEEYNQMRPEFINGMPKPSMLGCPGIKAEIKQEIDDDLSKNSLHRQPILPLIKQEGIKEEIKVEIKQEPMEETPEDFGAPMDALNSSQLPPLHDLRSEISQMSTTLESITDTSTVDESAGHDWTVSPNSLNSSANSEVLAEKSNQFQEPMSLDIEGDDSSDLELLEPITTFSSRGSPDPGTAANGKENSNSENDDRSSRYQNQGSYSSDEFAYRSTSNHSFYYGRLPKPNHVNTFGLVKLRGSTNFKKSILCTRRANSSIHAYQTLFQGGHCTFFRRESTNTLGSKHCTVDCNGAISLNGNSTFETTKGSALTSSSGASRNNCATASNSTKNVKQTRRQNSGNSPNSLLLKRQSSNFTLNSTSTQTPPSSPFYKRYNSMNAGNKVRLQKRSIIMHFRGNGSSQQHLSKTCAILQSQIVHKLAEQLLGFKKGGTQRNEQTIPAANLNKVGVTKQPLQQNHHGNNMNCKLPPSSPSVPTLMYQSTSSESGSLQPGSTSSSLPRLSSTLSSPSIHPQNSNNNSATKITRPGAITAGSCSAATSSSSLVKGTTNLGMSRMSGNPITQRFSTVTPVAIVAPLVTQTTTAGTPPTNQSMQTSSSISLTSCNNSGNIQPTRGRNSMYRQNSMLSSSPTSGSIAGVINGIGSVKTNNGSNTNGVN